MACKGFDGQVVRRDSQLSQLLDRFVCVRIIQANAMDLSLFQFDYDLTWAAFFLNADRTIYGRYGTRSQTNRKDDVSVPGFKKAMMGALELHKAFPANKQLLAGKTGRVPKYKKPEDYPVLKRFYGKLKGVIDPKRQHTCLHCHQVHNNHFRVYRKARKPIPDRVLWANPMPDWLGLTLDPHEKATVKFVAAGSSAEKAGFKIADRIQTLAGQPMISIADVQWVLEQAEEPGRIRAVVLRNGKQLRLDLTLGKGWRRKGDFSWRASNEVFSPTGEIEALTAAERKKLGLDGSALAVRLKYNHRPLVKGDVVVGLNGQRLRQSASEFLAYIAQQTKPGQKLSVTVIRQGKPLVVVVTVPKEL